MVCYTRQIDQSWLYGAIYSCIFSSLRIFKRPQRTLRSLMQCIIFQENQKSGSQACFLRLLLVMQLISFRTGWDISIIQTTLKVEFLFGKCVLWYCYYQWLCTFLSFDCFKLLQKPQLLSDQEFSTNGPTVGSQQINK